MGVSREDAAAIAQSARRLGLDPNSFGALLQLESGINPNIWGGAGGNYVGLIQFGPGARKEVGLPSGPMTIQQQLPYVEKYFSQRGYKPGGDPADNIKRAYRTVLVGNPHQSGTDSFGTNSDSAARRMLPGGDLYKVASSKLGDVGGLQMSPGPSAAEPSAPEFASTPSSETRGGFGNALADAIFGGEPSKKQGSTRFAAIEEAPVPALAEVQPGRMAALDLYDEEADKSLPNPWLEAIGGGRKRQPTEPVSQPEPASFSSAPAKGEAGEISIVDLGTNLQKIGFKVAEHPKFGGVGRHSPRSHHYAGHALDVTIQKGSPLLAGLPDSAWPELTAKYGEKLRKAFPGAEIFHPKHDPVGGHHEHIHIAFPGGKGRFNEVARQFGFIG